MCPEFVRARDRVLITPRLRRVFARGRETARRVGRSTNPTSTESDARLRRPCATVTPVGPERGSALSPRERVRGLLHAADRVLIATTCNCDVCFVIEAGDAREGSGARQIRTLSRSTQPSASPRSQPRNMMSAAWWERIVFGQVEETSSGTRPCDAF